MALLIWGVLQKVHRKYHFKTVHVHEILKFCARVTFLKIALETEYLLKDYLFESKYTGKDLFHLLVYLLNGYNSPGWADLVEVWSLQLHLGHLYWWQGSKHLHLDLSLVFQGTLVRSWNPSGATRTQVSIQMGYWCRKWCLNLHNTSLRDQVLLSASSLLQCTH